MKKILFSVIALFMTVLGAVAQCEAPTDVQASATWRTAKVSWHSPLLNTPTVLDYGVVYYYGIGNGAGTHTKGVRYPVDTMQRFAGKRLRSVSFYPYKALNFTLKIYTGGSVTDDTVFTPGTLVHTQQIPATSLTAKRMNEITLDAPLSVTGSEELWVTFEVTTTSAYEYPFGYGFDNAVAGATNIGIIDSTQQWKTWYSNAESRAPGILLQCNFIDACSITGFNVFRDNVQLNTTPVTDHSYTDSTVTPQQHYCYMVQSVCGTATGDSPTACTDIPAQPTCYPMVGNGTETVNNLPFSCYYDYSYSQQIYKASEIGAHSGTIASVTFQYFYTQPATFNNMTIYMANVSDSTFANSSSWIPSNQLAEVYSGPIYCSNADSNNVTVDFDQYFEWDGNSNVVVAILNNNGAYLDYSPRFYAHTTAEYQTLYAQRDALPYNISAPGSGATMTTKRNNMKFCFGPEPACYKPTFVTVADITSSGATLSWHRHSESDNSWQLVAVPSGSPVSSGIPVTANDTTYTFTALQENTVYDVYVKTVCSDADQSGWVTVTFRTLCTPHVGVPYTENFSNYGAGEEDAFPYCWTRLTNNTSEQYPYINEDYQLEFYSRDTVYALAATQALDLSSFAAHTLAVSFELAKGSSTSGRLDVGVMTNPYDLSTLTVLKSYYPADVLAEDVFQQEQITLPQAYTQPVYIAFYAPRIGASLVNSVYLKNVKVDNAPDCSAPSRLTVSNVTGTAATVSWQAAQYGAQSYTLTYGAAGQTPTQLTVQGTSQMLTGLTQGTQYQVQLYTNCAEGSADTLVTQFATLNFVECSQPDTNASEITGVSHTTSYLIPVNNYYKYTYSQQIYTADEIDSAHTPSVLTAIAFEYSSSSQMTNKTDVSIYLAHRTTNTFSNMTDWTPISEATLVYQGPLNCSQGWNKLDFDDYFSYNGTDNLVLIVDDNSFAYNGSSYTFNTHDVYDYKTLYLYSDYTNIDPTSPSEGISYMKRNDVKFYKCQQVVPQSCPVPMVYVSGQESDEVSVAWVSNGSETSWNLEYRLVGDTAWTNAGTVTSSPHTLSNLATDVTYEIRLQALCSAGDSSLWAYTTAHTPCNDVDLPLTEDFETGTAGNVPGCWSRIYNTTTATPAISELLANGGTKSLLFNCSSSNKYAYLVSPRLNDNVAMDSLQISLAAYKTSRSYFIQAGIMTDADDPSTFVSVGQISPSSINVWENGEAITRNYNGNGRYVALRIPQWFANSIYVDDIVIQYIPNCMHVENITATNILATSATITWTPGGSETSWNYLVGPSGTLNPETDIPLVTSDNTVTIDELVPNTLYDIYVQASCSGTDQSTWERYRFRTGCAAIATLPYTENFDSYVGETDIYDGTNVMPSCWSRINTGSDTYAIFPTVYSSSDANSPSNLLYFYTYGYEDCSDIYAVLPEIDTLQLPINTLQMLFNARSQYSGYAFDIQLGVMSNPALASSFVPVDTVQVTSATSYTPVEVNFNNYTGGGQYIAIKVSKPATFYSGNFGFIDDIVLKLQPQCSPVRNINVENVTGSSAYVSWETGSIGTVSHFTLEYAEDEEDPIWTVADNSITNNWYLLGNLDPQTNYIVRVKTACEDGDSDYETAEFTTNCLAGGTVSIGNGTITSGYFPTYSNWNYSYTQQIYLASELGGASTLRSVSFEVDEVNAAIRTVQIYLMHTSVSSSSNWLPATSAQLVYSGQTNFTAGWNTFNFSAPFQYNGTDNLALIVIDQTGSYEYSNMFKVHAGTSDCSMFAYNDDDAYSTAMAPPTGNNSSSRNNVRFGGDCDSTVTCIAPNIYVSAAGETNATVVWARGHNENAWEMDYAISGDSVWTSVPNPTGYSVQISGLTSNTPYQVRMRSVCGTGDESQYVYTSFRTDCGILSIPYTEDFNSYTNGISDYTSAPSGYPSVDLPSCWNFLNITSLSSTYPQAFLTSSSYVASSGNALLVKTHATTPAVAVLPLFNVDINTLQMTFKYRNEGTMSAGNLEVGYVTNPNDASTFVSLHQCTPYTEMTEMEQVFSSVPPLGAGNSYIAFRFNGGSYNSYYVCIDDIYVETIPTCPRPAALTVANVTSSSVDLAWTETGTATTWNIEYGTRGFTQGTGTTVAATTNPFTVTGLTLGTAYDFYVQADCGAGDASNWRGPVTATPGSYNMPVSGTVTLTLCDGIIYDDGGATGSYSNNCSGTIVINPATAGNVVKVQGIGGFETEGNYDYLTIYDGPDNMGTQLFTTQGNSSGTIPECTSTTGPITLYFYSDYSGVYSGFALQVSCVDTTGGDPDPGPTPPEPGVICDAPTNLTVSDVTFNSANLTWTQTGTPDSWTIYFRKGTDAWTTANTSTPSPYALTDLAPESNYEAYVVAVCGDSVSSPSNTVTFSTLADGIADYVLNQTKLYPNPTSSNVTIVNNNCMIEKVEVYDVYGQTLRIQQVNGNSVVLPAEELAAGMYFVRIITDKGTVVKPFTKR
jgi:hypothetical protein